MLLGGLEQKGFNILYDMVFYFLFSQATVYAFYIKYMKKCINMRIRTFWTLSIRLLVLEVRFFNLNEWFF